MARDLVLERGRDVQDEECERDEHQEFVNAAKPFAGFFWKFRGSAGAVCRQASASPICPPRSLAARYGHQAGKRQGDQKRRKMPDASRRSPDVPSAAVRPEKWRRRMRKAPGRGGQTQARGLLPRASCAW